VEQRFTTYHNPVLPLAAKGIIHPPPARGEQDPLVKEMRRKPQAFTIVVDTREQNPLQFTASANVTGIVTKTLPVGDYSLLGYEHNIAVERKSATDLFGTLGKGHKRFEQELRKSLQYDCFIILVECPFRKIQQKDFPEAHHSKMRGDVIIDILFTIKFKYGIDVIFATDRNEASAIIRNLFKAYLKHRQASVKKVIEEQHQRMFLSWKRKFSTVSAYG
jgi:ERCC4-type nuclease